jgi:KaiC/GvpD/RAD55 family RecA-like ATPase
MSEPLPPGTNILVEYDPTSAWYAASLTIAAGWLRTGGIVWYATSARPPEDIRTQLTRLKVNVEPLEKEEKLRIADHYSVTLGQKSNEEKWAQDSLKVADLSIWIADIGRAPPEPDILVIFDDLSVLSRFNEEKVWIEYQLTRTIPIQRKAKTTSIRGIIKGLHSDSAYRRLEAANDGVIDFKLDETGEKVQTLMRIRAMNNVHFDSCWHLLKVGENFEVSLDK